MYASGHVHEPGLALPTSPHQQAIFDQGHEVGLEARKLFPNGADIDTPNLSDALKATQAAIADGATTIYEATFADADVLVRADILHRRNVNSPWNLIEVKSSTSVKDEHVVDAALQAHVIENAGTRLNGVAVMHLNSQCIWPTNTDLFSEVDVTKDLSKHQKELPNKISDIKSALEKPTPPEIDIGPQCKSPYNCAFIAHCWKGVPSPSVFDLPGFREIAWDYYRQGVLRLDDDRLEPFKGTRLHQVRAITSGERWVDRKIVQSHLATWAWPLHFLDFETISYAIPRIRGTRPYQQVPFQFSCHVQDSSGELIHREYLHRDAHDPRPGFVAALLRSLGQSGSVVAYHKTFEASRIRELAATFPEHSAALESIVHRLVDPLPIFREGVYDAKFKGSFSLKSVAPAILGERASYGHLEIQDGNSAQRGFASMVDGNTPEHEQVRLRNALLAYCRQDTLVMVELVQWLLEQ